MISLNEDIIVLDNYVDPLCVRHVHVMSNLEISANMQLRYAPAGCGSLTREIGAWHFRAEYAYRGVLDIACVGTQKKFRRLVVWNVQGYSSVKMALHDALKEYCRLFGGKPQYAFMLKLPIGIDNGFDVGEVTLMQAEWMLDRCVAVGCNQ